ncbi:MAG: hypothetical protein EXS76_04320 [Nitrosarchaeum sp.]|nr:hypothetical protein [Nitrosarchaeum sp.]
MEQIIEEAKSYTGIFGMHKYWSKKPFNLVESLICQNSKEGDIVLDPFCGSGISVIESILNKRKGIGVDINPMAIFILKQTLSKINPVEIQTEFKKIQEDIADKINKLYSVKRGKDAFIGTHYVWEKEILLEVWYKNDLNKKIIEKPTKDDLKFIESFSYESIDYFYPKQKLIENSRINAKKSMYVHDLFTPRNLLALAILFDRINQIKSKKLKELFQFCFTALLGQASRMVFVIEKRMKMSGEDKLQPKSIGSWVIGYWIPKKNFEINVWNCFKNRYNRIYKAKKEQYESDYSLEYSKSFTDLDKNNVLLLNESSLDFLRTLKDNSIDYVITDPPHGDRLPYLELSMMWNSWMKFTPDFEKELVVSDAKIRQKNTENYNKLFKLILLEIGRVLKQGKTFTLMFNSLDDESWNSILEIIDQSTLKLSKIGTMSYSANSVVQDNRKRGLETDFVLHFIKSSERPPHLHKLSIQDEKKIIRTIISDYKSKKKSFRHYELINHVVDSLLNKGVFFKISSIIEEIDISES